MAVIHKFLGNVKHIDYQWDGIMPQPSPETSAAKFTKFVLLGPDDGMQNFVIRYFQLPVGGASPLHEHAHEHGIVVVHGKGSLRINESFYDVSALDAVFIPGNELHQIRNTGDEPFGFFCTIMRSAEYT